MWWLFGGLAFGKRPGSEGRVSWVGSVPSLEKPRKVHLSLCHVGTQREGPWTRKSALTEHRVCWCLHLALQPPEPWEINICVYKPPRHGILLMQPKWLRHRPMARKSSRSKEAKKKKGARKRSKGRNRHILYMGLSSEEVWFFPFLSFLERLKRNTLPTPGLYQGETCYLWFSAINFQIFNQNSINKQKGKTASHPYSWRKKNQCWTLPEVW